MDIKERIGMKLGLIGLGVMGKPMAKNLLKAGYDLTVSDHNESPVDELVTLGAKKAANGREIARQCDVILTMLPNSPQVKDVVLGRDGVLESVKAGAYLIDMSSINPIASREIAAKLAEKGVEMLDAPVSRRRLTAPWRLWWAAKKTCLTNFSRCWPQWAPRWSIAAKSGPAM